MVCQVRQVLLMWMYSIPHCMYVNCHDVQTAGSSLNERTYQKGTFYMWIRCFNKLPFKTNALVNNVKLYKIALKHFLYFHSFYSLQEYFDLKNYKWNYILLYLVLDQCNVYYICCSFHNFFYLIFYVANSSPISL